jgi:hypothetical protein
MAARSEPAWGSVMFIVPVHSPDTSRGSQVALSASEPAISSASMAPWVRVMTWEKDRLADFHISLTATASRRGRPCRRRAGQGHPAALGAAIGVGEAGGGAHFALAVGAGQPARAVPVAHRVEGRQHVAGEARPLRAPRRSARRRSRRSRGADRAALDQLMNDEAHVAQGAW